MCRGVLHLSISSSLVVLMSLYWLLVILPTLSFFHFSLVILFRLSLFVYYSSLIVLWNVFVVFFFKQKTAYEFRISDWSSDVCSSDLFGHEHVGHSSASFRRRTSMMKKGVPSSAVTMPTWSSPGRATIRPSTSALSSSVGPSTRLQGRSQRWSGPQKIGRAACRERGCQYV